MATMDHSIPTTKPVDGRTIFLDPQAEAQVRQLERNCEEFGIKLYPLGDDQQGIVHVIGPELGVTQPGRTIVCGDSHTSTHGAFGALAFGIGTTEVAHVLASQCLLQRKPKTFAIRLDGALPAGVTAKDVILAIIAKIGVHGGNGHVIEYTGSCVRSLSMEERMTICNMSIEAGARAGMMAPDDVTFEYLADRPLVPQGPCVGRGLGWLASHAERSGKPLRSRSHSRCRKARAHDHLWYEPRHGGTRSIPLTTSGHGQPKSARVYGSEAGAITARPSGRRRLHR